MIVEKIDKAYRIINKSSKKTCILGHNKRRYWSHFPTQVIRNNISLPMYDNFYVEEFSSPTVKKYTLDKKEIKEIEPDGYQIFCIKPTEESSPELDGDIVRSIRLVLKSVLISKEYIGLAKEYLKFLDTGIPDYDQLMDFLSSLKQNKNGIFRS